LNTQFFSMAAKETKCGTQVAYGMRIMSNFEYTHSAQKARDTTLDDKNNRCNIIEHIIE